MTKTYCEKYDAYFDSQTGEWQEQKCTDPKCEFCPNRPSRHFSHKWITIDGKKEVCE